MMVYVKKEIAGPVVTGKHNNVGLGPRRWEFTDSLIKYIKRICYYQNTCFKLSAKDAIS